VVDFGGAGEIGSQLLEKIMSGTIIVFGILIFGLLITGIVWYVSYMRKFNIKVRVKSKMSTGVDGNPSYKIFYDKGAILFKKKDKRSFFRIKGERVDLPSPPFEVREFLDKGGSEIGIRKESENEYYYEIPGIIEKKYILKDGKKIPYIQQNTRTVGSGDAYWNVLRKRDNRKLFDLEGLLGKLAPIIGMVLMFMLVIFLTYMITDKWGVFQEAAKQLNNAAQAIREATTASAALG